MNEQTDGQIYIFIIAKICIYNMGSQIVIYIYSTHACSTYSAARLRNPSPKNTSQLNDIINKPCLSTWFEFLKSNLVDIVVVHYKIFFWSD